MLTLGLLTFSQDELSYENQGRPLLLTSAPPPTGYINSYLRTEGGTVLTLYNPTINNNPRSWDLNLILTDARYNELVDYAEDLSDIPTTYRASLNTGLLTGINLVYKGKSADVFISSVSITDTYVDVATNQIKNKVRVALVEIEG